MRTNKVGAFVLGCIVCITIAVLFTGCSNKKFDRDKWYYGDGIEFPLRDQMLDDLLKNHQLKGLKYPKIVGLLHRPQGKDSLSIYYEVTLNIDKKTHAISHKDLVFYFNKDSVVTDYKIEERK